MTQKQSAAGIIPDADPTTFAEVLAKINESDAFLEALAKQPDETPIINLNSLVHAGAVGSEFGDRHPF